MTGNHEYEVKADEISRVFAESVAKNPSAHAFLMIAVDFAVGPTYSLVISGDTEEKDTKDFLDSIRLEYLPNKTILFHPTEQESPEIQQIARFIGDFNKYQNKATAYVCVNKACEIPTNEIKKMINYLNPIRI